VKILYESICGRPFLGPIFDSGNIFQGLDIDFEFSIPKRHILAWGRVIWVIARINVQGGLICGRVIKKLHINKKNFCYISPICREPATGGFAWNFGQGLLADVLTSFNFFCPSVQGFRICKGSNFAILHWLSRSPLTQGCAYVVLSEDVLSMTNFLRVLTNFASGKNCEI